VANIAAAKTRPHRFSLRFCNLVMRTERTGYDCCSLLHLGKLAGTETEALQLLSHNLRANP
jgi:hypothetical protein